MLAAACGAVAPMVPDPCVRGLIHAGIPCWVGAKLGPVVGQAEAAVEGIDETGVSAWFAAHVPDVQLPLQFSLIAGGRSNLTFSVQDQRGRAMVLRRPPLGHVLETAHDMAREHRIIAALHGHGVPVAQTFGLCRDNEVNGAPFYVMAFAPGVVLNDAAAARTIAPDNRRALGEHIIDVLARLHTVDPDAIGLGELGRKEAYLARQLKRWSKQYADSQTDDIPEMDECQRLLQARMPAQVGSGIVHGDYRPGNLMVLQREVSAVLDWELCTLGDPLADVGYLLNHWGDPADGESELSPIGVGGFLNRAQLCARYTAATGRDLGQINYYRAFSHWRLAAIQQGVYKRYKVGAMGSQVIDLSGYMATLLGRVRTALDLLAGG